MKYRATLKRAAAFLAAILLSLSLTLNAYAAQTNERTVRIPCNYNDFLRVDENSNATGILADYLEKLAELNNWKYEYVSTNWNEAMNMLQTGEIDFLFPTNYSDEREEIMDFSAIPIGYTASGLFALDKSKFNYDDFEGMNGAKIAFVQSSSNEYELNDFAKKHNFTYKPVYVDSNDGAIQALRDGKADLIVFSAANEFSDGILVSVMEAKPIYFSVREGNEEMLSLINQGMQTIIRTQSDIVAALIKNSMIGNNGSTSALTSEEREFILSESEIKMGFYCETEPLAYQKEDGTFDGVYINVLNYLKKEAGLNIKLVPITRDKSWKELLKAGEIDFYIGSSEIFIKQDAELCATDHFLEYTNILVTKNTCAFNKLTNPVIALTNGRAYWADYLKGAINKDLQFKYYKTAKDCMLAVAKGEADASLLNNIEYNYHSKNARLSSLIQWQQYRFPTKVGLVALTSVDDAMFSTVSKLIDTIPSDYVNTLVEESLSMPYQSFSVADTLYNARFPLIAVGFFLILLSIASIISTIFRKQQEQIKNEAEQRERQQLQIIAALSQDNIAIYYTDLEKDYCEIIQSATETIQKNMKQKSHSGAMRDYINHYIQPEYREMLMPLCDPKKIIERFKETNDFSVRFQIVPRGEVYGYYEMHFVEISANENEHKMVFGVRCINETIREEQEQQKILRDALDGANRANAAKSEFLSRMSHDIRTPMNAIIGMTAIAEAHLDDKQRVHDSLNKITNASHHLLNLINDVLDMSKIESGKLNLNEEDINLSELIDNLLNIMQPQIKQHKHHLDVNISEIKHKMVIGDSLRIRQAFINLMGNAVKYTPDGGRISLTVREKPLTVSNVGCYEFVFADNGIGMSKEILKTIFEPFARAEDSKISKIQGTGLGLPITRNIVQMMNGSIQVESELNKGSTFTMTIFLRLQENQEETYSGGASPQGTPTLSAMKSNDFSGRRVLLVEDNILNREIAREVLEMVNLTVEEAVNGLEAVEMFSSSDIGYYDIILMDIQMPIMNGYDSTIAIRSQERSDAQTIPIIAMTANAFVEDKQAATSAGMNEHLSKPIDFARLSEILNKYLNK